MSRPNTSIKAIQNNEIIPRRLTDGSYLAEIPTISGDINAVTSSPEINVPSINNNGENYELFATVDNNVVTFKLICVA